MVLQRLFSKRVGYGVHFLCLLTQRQPLAATPLAELALGMARVSPGTSATYLSKVVQALVQSGVLVSLRGSAGGYSLALPPAEISLLDIICALEGPLDTRCPLTPSGPCSLRERCTNRSILQDFQDEVSALLSQLTIDRLARNLPRPEEYPESASGSMRQSLPISKEHSDDPSYTMLLGWRVSDAFCWHSACR
jgi:Rrf2 family protein